jgi:CrcB protein
MRRPLLVFVGGGCGACLRALLLAWLQPWGVSLPVPVLLANVLGAFLLGVVSVLADEVGLLQAETRLFLAVGVLGGFTTFSTLGWDADLLLVQGARRGAGLIYLGASLSGVAAVSVGILAGRALVAVLERGAVALLRRLDERGMRRTGEAHGPSARRGRRA